LRRRFAERSVGRHRCDAALLGRGSESHTESNG
jgi:hypothetical protein